MGKSFDRSYKRMREHARKIKDIYQQARIYHLDENRLNAKLCEIFNGDQYRKMPIWAKSHIEGMAEVLWDCHNSLLVYSYVVNGVRLSIESPEYRQVSPRYVTEHCSESGAFIYRDNGAMFTCHEMGPQNNNPALKGKAC